MPAFLIPAIMAAGSALSSWLSNRGKKTTSDTTGTSSWTSGESLDPQYSGLQGELIKQMMARLGSPVPMEGYEGMGLANINKSFDLTGQTTNNMLSARGLSTSPIAANADLTREMARAGETSGFLNNLPLLERSLRDQDWQNALSIFQARPKTTFGTGTQTGTGAGTISGDQGAMTSTLTELLAYLKGLNSTSKTTGPYTI